MNEKVARIEALAVKIAQAIDFKDIKSVEQAARLCKADLTSGMVGEFPELQGIMGRYYALAQGEKPEIADAIRDHYKPLGASDSVPEAPLAAIIAVADKLDSIISLFAAGEKPTGSKDPLALRRAALGILRIVQHHGWNIDLAMLIADAKIWPEIIAFFDDRLRNLLRDEGIRHDIIEASTGRASSGFNSTAITAKTKALTTWLDSAPGKASLAAIKRALNILAAEEKKSKQSFNYAAKQVKSLTQPSEQSLIQLLQQNAPAAPQQLEAFTAPINSFFDAVLVTEPTFRDARLALLAGVRDASQHIADFSKIEG